jgi:hypothetical protein
MSAAASPSPPLQRTLMHTRQVVVQVFERSDGLFDVEASLQDTKTFDMPLATGVRPAGEPIHAMQLQLVVDRTLGIQSATSVTTAMPYVGTCDQHGNAYAQLAGLNLMRGFRAAVNQRLAGRLGCTHLTEMCAVLPTAVLQAFAGRVLDVREGSDDAHPPYQLDRCHALRREGPVVQTYYPRWFQSGEPIPTSSQQPRAATPP